MALRATLAGLLVLAAASAATALPPRDRIAEAERALEASDTADIPAALDALAAAKSPRAVESLAAFLRAGQPDALTDHALEALGEAGRSEALGVLAEFTTHRRVAARRAAYAAIGRLDGPDVTALLSLGLGDGDPLVRGLCATALGRRGATDALEVLFRALDRGVPEAAAAIGRLGDAASIGLFHARLEGLPLSTMLSGYEAFLRREDLDERTKLDVVGRLGEVASVPVKTFLLGLAPTIDAQREPRLRRSLLETAARIDRPAPTAPEPTR